MTDIRVTREAVEVLADVDLNPAIQATRIAAEVVTNFDTNPVIQVTRFAVEVLYVVPVAFVNVTQQSIQVLTDFVEGVSFVNVTQQSIAVLTTFSDVLDSRRVIVTITYS